MTSRIRTATLAALVALPLALASTHADAQPKSLVVGGSSVGGLYYIWAGGWANLMQDRLGYRATAEATGGAVANIRLIQQGDIDAGITTMGALYAGLTGTGWTEGVEHADVRVIFPAYQSFVQFWALQRSGLETVRDIEGRIFSPGTAGGTAAVEGPRIFELLGIQPANTVHIGYSDANGQLADGLLDVVAASTGVPAPQITDLQASHAVTVLNLDPADAETITAEMPYFAIGQIPADSYDNQPEPITALALWNVFIVHKDMPEDDVYELVRTTFDNRSALEAVHVSAADTLAEYARLIRAPFHPGAARYYAEQGIEVPTE
jgi:uncharacterized protein